MTALTPVLYTASSIDAAVYFVPGKFASPALTSDKKMSLDDWAAADTIVSGGERARGGLPLATTNELVIDAAWPTRCVSE